MATIKVSSNSQLQSALRSIGSGGTIELASGTYDLKASGGDLKNTVISEAAGARVSFSSVEIRNASHMTIEGVDFKLPAGKKGIVVAGSSDITIKDAHISGPTSQGTVGIFVNDTRNFTLQNSDITGFATAVKLSGITGLNVSNNNISNTSWDAMIVGGVHNAVFSNNDISLNIPSNRKHTDGMQFYNTGKNNALSDVTIKGNTIETHNNSSHGIYMANHLADIGGGSNTFFKNIVIQDNTIISGQVSGIAVGQTTKLNISDNVILQDTHHHSTKMINIPVIRVHKDSTGVSITDNTTHKLPEASGSGWFPTGKSESSWNISHNKIVPLGTTGHASAAPAATVESAASAETLSVASAATVLDTADVFRFDSKGSADVVKGVDFDAGDSIVLHDYAKGTFASGAAGSSATIGSLEALHALDKASSSVHVHEGKNDMLVIDIDQPGADHVVKLVDMAHAYF